MTGVPGRVAGVNIVVCMEVDEGVELSELRLKLCVVGFRVVGAVR